mgnify:CR=1 FL=1
MHYPHRISRIKKVRSIGFRARMSTRKGRAILNRKRRVGRAIRVRDVAEACEVANLYAPEHLALQTVEADKLVNRISAAGAVFVPLFILVIVQTFRQDTPLADLAFQRVRLEEQAIVQRVQNELALLVLDAHLRDLLVPV